MPDPATPAATVFSRATTGQFLPGRSGNPAGRPRGARNKVSRLVELLNDGEEKAIARAVVDRALAGDQVALRACFTRLVPPAKSAPVEIDLPATATRADVAAASSALIAAMAAGEITPLEAEQAMKLLVTHSRLLDVRDRSASAAQGAADADAEGSTKAVEPPSSVSAPAGPAAPSELAAPVATMPQEECCSGAFQAKAKPHSPERAPAPEPAPDPGRACISPVIPVVGTSPPMSRPIGNPGVFPPLITWADRPRLLGTSRPGRRATLLAGAAFDNAFTDRHAGLRTDGHLSVPLPSARRAPGPSHHRQAASCGS